VFVPGGRGAALSDRETAGWPERLVLKLYDLPAQTDQAAHVIRRSNLEFILLRGLCTSLVRPRPRGEPRHADYSDEKLK